MAWVTAEKKIVGTVTISEVPVAPATPTPKPVIPPEISVPYEEVLRRHEALRTAIEAAGKKGNCITLNELGAATNLDLGTVDKHWKILKGDLYAVETDDKEDFRICNLTALDELYRSLQRLIKIK